jgi:hypothetical protein
MIQGAITIMLLLVLFVVLSAATIPMQQLTTALG